MTWVMVVLPVALLVLGFPIFLVLLATVTVATLWAMEVSPMVLPQIMFGAMSNFALLAVPFFIFAGELMGQGGISRRLVALVLALIGGVRGSLPLTAVGAAALFGAISGSTAANVAAIGQIVHRPLRDRGYGEGFAGGVVVAAGSLDNLIPPSIAMILYGIAAEVSIVKLFVAGIVPGLVLAAFLAAYVHLHARRRGIRETERFEARVALAAARAAAWGLGAPVIILGGIYAGVFSPTEAAGIACVYAIAVTLAVYREVDWRRLWAVAVHAMYLTTQIFVIVAVAAIFSWLLTTAGVAQAATGFLARLGVEPWLLLLAINAFLLLVGCFIDTASAILVLSPLLAPIAAALGVDPLHFGIIVTMNLSIGTFTPPFGINIFVAQALFPTPLAELYRGLLPFIAVSLAALLLVTYVPELSLWLVGAVS
jgi:C4-dicarboxylate transporter DctM subunit